MNSSRTSSHLLLASIGSLALLVGAGAASAAGGYVGSDVCLGCHEDVQSDFQHTIHAKVFGAGNPSRTERMQRGCEACHGPGEAHVSAGGGSAGSADWLTFEAATPDDVARENASCLGCHAGGKLLYWDGSPHENRGNACTSCHDTHEKISGDHQLAFATQAAVCSQCHLQPRAGAWRSAHHPTREGPASGTSDVGREGAMDCGSCHNPHGTVTEGLISATSINDQCYACHADKRGPWLWEHEPVQEDCTNCHSPHGSIHPSMLKVASPRLCQSCHNPSLHPTEARTPGSRFVIQQSCGNCHQLIHGSNHPSGMFFTR